MLGLVCICCFDPFARPLNDKKKNSWYCQNLKIQFFGFTESGFFTE